MKTRGRPHRAGVWSATVRVRCGVEARNPCLGPGVHPLSMIASTAEPAMSSIRRSGPVVLWAASCLVFTTLLLSIRLVEQVPWFITVLLIGFAAMSAWRPSAALIALAAAIPVAAWTGRTWNGSIAWPETLVVGFAAGYSARAVWSRSEQRDNLGLPIFIFTAIVVASLAVRLVVLYRTIGGGALRLQLWQIVTTDYFVGSGGFRDLDAAMRLIEGMVLLWAAASVARSSPGFAPRLVRWFVAGAAAAGVLNLWRIWQGALRLEEPVAVFFGYLTSLRYNVHYGDVNAAGSYFVMALLVAIGLTIATRRVRWIPAVVLIAASLMLSGSRTALAAGGLTGLAWGLLGGVPLGRRSRRALVFAALLIAAAVPAVYILATGRHAAPSAALQIRTEFARTTFRMVGSHPVFGIGVGQYQERSGSYSAPILIQTFRLQSENAHNNFFQVLGELGIAGLAGFLWVLGSAAVRSARAAYRTTNPLQRGVVAGLLAFVLTWLAGHPLLIDEPALLFWLLLGTAPGLDLRAPENGVHARAGLAAVGVAAVILVVLSIPIRAGQEVADAELEHRGIGLSLWQHGEDGVRYRLAGARSTVFVPADARVVTFAVRAVQPGVELHVAVRMDGRRADVIRVAGDRWYEAELVLPTDRDAPRFRRLELRVEGERPDDRPLLMVGKIERR